MRKLLLTAAVITAGLAPVAIGAGIPAHAKNVIAPAPVAGAAAPVDVKKIGEVGVVAPANGGGKVKP